jgi:4-alpha-glucanotransferase
VSFGREICGELVQAERREWWLTNGIGGYAAGTVAGSLTRRYHGLLVAPVNPPLGRMLLVAKADATLIDGEREWPLYTNRWQDGAVEPAGHVHIESFHLDGRMPVWSYALGGVRLEARIWMEHGSNTTCLAYRLEESPVSPRTDLSLRLKILVNARDHHGETSPYAFQPTVEEWGHLHVDYPQGFALHVTPYGGSVQKEVFWVENFDLPLERERGLPDRDSHLCLGHANLKLVPGKWGGIVFSLSGISRVDLATSMHSFLARDTELLNRAVNRLPASVEAPAWVRQIILAADSFIFSRPVEGTPDGESVIAGYPWFGDWGRDTMISLPGLTLATGRFETARRILLTFARFVEHGMMPNLFPGDGREPEYNTVDAALWYIEAWRAYIEASDDFTALEDAFPILNGIVTSYRDGTRYGIQMDHDDSLLRAGEAGTQLTWMDAKVEDRAFTPRIGKPVEVNALWYNAICAMADLAGTIGRPDQEFHELAGKIRHSFKRFLNGEWGLYDVLDGPEGHDGTLRPNQVIAVSLHHSPLDRAAQQSVLAVCERHLLCSYGLRSLAPFHSDYRPQYKGDVRQRDSGYHQGPVWGWLLGHYALALYRVTGNTAHALEVLEKLHFHLQDAGLGTVSEIFDGDPPHHPRGCPSQAWSVACALEAWWKIERAENKQDTGKEES